MQVGRHCKNYISSHSESDLRHRRAALHEIEVACGESQLGAGAARHTLIHHRAREGVDGHCRPGREVLHNNAVAAGGYHGLPGAAGSGLFYAGIFFLDDVHKIFPHVGSLVSFERSLGYIQRASSLIHFPKTIVFTSRGCYGSTMYRLKAAATIVFTTDYYSIVCK